MHKNDKTHSVLFRKISKYTVFLNLVVIGVSFFVVEAFLPLATGVVMGSLAAHIKLYLTFHGMHHAMTAEDTKVKAKLLTGVASILSYILLAAVLIITALLGEYWLAGSIAGVFTVYLAVLIYMISIAVRKR